MLAASAISKRTRVIFRWRHATRVKLYAPDGGVFAFNLANNPVQVRKLSLGCVFLSEVGRVRSLSEALRA